MLFEGKRRRRRLPEIAVIELLDEGLQNFYYRCELFLVAFPAVLGVLVNGPGNLVIAGGVDNAALLCMLCVLKYLVVPAYPEESQQGADFRFEIGDQILITDALPVQRQAFCTFIPCAHDACVDFGSALE